MSTLIVTNAHIDALVNSVTKDYHDERCTYYFNGAHHSLFRNQQITGTILLDQNKKDFHETYPLETFTGTCFYLYAGSPYYTPVQVLKLCDSYLYQICDAKGWRETEAFWIIKAIRERATQNLPGYKNAQWCL